MTIKNLKVNFLCILCVRDSDFLDFLHCLCIKWNKNLYTENKSSENYCMYFFLTDLCFYCDKILVTVKYN